MGFWNRRHPAMVGVRLKFLNVLLKALAATRMGPLHDALPARTRPKQRHRQGRASPTDLVSDHIAYTPWPVNEGRKTLAVGASSFTLRTNRGRLAFMLRSLPLEFTHGTQRTPRGWSYTTPHSALRIHAHDRGPSLV